MDLSDSGDLALAIIILGVMAFIGASIFATYSADRLITNSTSISESVITATTATLTSTPTGSVTATRKNLTWLEFDGVNDEVDLNYDVNVVGIQKRDENHTWSVWFNSSNSGSSDEGRLFDIIPNSWSLGIGSNAKNFDGKLIYQNKNATTFYNLNSTYALNNSQWHHVIITLSAENGNASMYINGTIDNSITIISITSNIALLDLSTPFSTSSLRGYMDEIRLYNRTLTPTEVSEIYLSGREPNASLPSDGLVLWLPLNEGTGADVSSVV